MNPPRAAGQRCIRTVTTSPSQMPFRQSISDHQGNGLNIMLDSLPDECPICHRQIDPRRSGGSATDPEGQKVEIFFQCPHSECRHLFIGRYGVHGGGTYEWQASVPKHPAPQSFSPEISGISPIFVEVYNQAISAEAAQLDQISGIGLRKALEFLIKDFAIHYNSHEEEKIRKSRLANCIDDYITDPKLKAMASRAVWLGNDETHYVRQWGDRDIDDLRMLIRLTVNWIEHILLTEKYEAGMQR